MFHKLLCRIRPSLFISSVLPLCLMAFQANAVPINGTPFYTTVDDPANHVVSAGMWSGVASLSLNRTDGNFNCTGSLLPTGQYVLTAAHCLTSPTGSTNLTTSATATFNLSSGPVSIPVTNYYINPNWAADFIQGNDIAVIELASMAPSDAERYGLYTNTNEVGQDAAMIGYGHGGLGTTGEDQSTYPFGTKRSGLNTFDSLADSLYSLAGATYTPGNQLLYDFDDGTSAHDAAGFYLGLANTGLGVDEVMQAPGDSGGPSFLFDPLTLDPLIAGVVSWGICIQPNTTLGSTFFSGSSDIDNCATAASNSSFGEFATNTRVSYYTSFINSIITRPAPEPETLALMGLGLTGLLFVRRKMI